VQTIVGTWLSLVERTLGVGEVASSNLVVPTNLLFFYFEQLTAETILLFRTPHERLLVDAFAFEESLSVSDWTICTKPRFAGI
jgi:hypothetical protein